MDDTTTVDAAHVSPPVDLVEKGFAVPDSPTKSVLSASSYEASSYPSDDKIMASARKLASELDMEATSFRKFVKLLSDELDALPSTHQKGLRCRRG